METKICTKCGNDKELKEFYFRNDSNSYRNECIKCIKIDRKEKYPENMERISSYKKEYFRKFPWVRTLQDIKTRCENPNFKQYNDYGGKGIKCLISVDELEYLWYRDKAYQMEKPSIDRKNSNKNYILDNCQFIEMEVNRIKDRHKPIFQFNLNGNFITNWDSIKTASLFLNIKDSDISRVCKGKRQTAGGFKWEYNNVS